MDLIAIIAAFISAHPWAMIVFVLLFAISEALPYFPNIEAYNVVQLFTNILKLVKEKLSLKDSSVQQ